MIKIAVVTGCASFLGTVFTTKLLENGWYVYGIDKLTYVANDNIVKEKVLHTNNHHLEDKCERCIQLGNYCKNGLIKYK